MAGPWNGEEDRLLLQWIAQCQRWGWKRADSFSWIAERLRRSESACYERRNTLRRTAYTHARRTDARYLTERIKKLEEKLETSQDEIKKLIVENRKIREEMRFFETMLLEEYRLLNSLMDKRRPKSRIHRL